MQIMKNANEEVQTPTVAEEADNGRLPWPGKNFRKT